jgi:tetratricopeptide (TPR) repeat protein
MAVLLVIVFLALGGSPLPAQAPPASSDFEVLSAQADAARVANRLDEAVGFYEKALALRPAWAEGWWSLGTIQYDRDAYAEAARAFERAVALQPKNGTAKVMLGLCEFQLGGLDTALEHLEEGKSLGIANDPQLKHVMLYHEGVLLQRKKRFEGAQEALQTLCGEGVQNDELTRALGMVALRIAGPSPGTGATPGADIFTRVGQAECLAAQHKFDEAKQVYRGLVQHFPHYANMHYAFGRFLLEARDPQAAKMEFEQELKNNPRHVFARLEIAAVDYKVDSAAGVPYAQEAVKLEPRLPFGHYLLGLLLVDIKDYLAAVPELEIARQAFPRETGVYYALGDAYFHLGHKKEAALARATFTRLNRETQTGAKSTDYGEGPSALTRTRLESETTTQPH